MEPSSVQSAQRALSIDLEKSGSGNLPSVSSVSSLGSLEADERPSLPTVFDKEVIRAPSKGGFILNDLVVDMPAQTWVNEAMQQEANLTNLVEGEAISPMAADPEEPAVIDLPQQQWPADQAEGIANEPPCCCTLPPVKKGTMIGAGIGAVLGIATLNPVGIILVALAGAAIGAIIGLWYHLIQQCSGHA